MIPKLNASALGVGQTFPWPLSPQGSWHEITGVAGEARGAAGGVALDHLHSGLDVRGARGDCVFSVMDEKVSSPISNWGFQESGEGIRVGLMTYIHLHVGRTVVGTRPRDDTARSARSDSNRGSIHRVRYQGVRVRRGTRFKVGDFIGSLNWLNHVHLNLGPWNAQTNPLVLPFFALKDTVAPTIESIEVLPRGRARSSRTAKERRPNNPKPGKSNALSSPVTCRLWSRPMIELMATSRIES